MLIPACQISGQQMFKKEFFDSLAFFSQIAGRLAGFFFLHCKASARRFVSLPVALDLLRSLRFCFAGFCSRSAHGRCCSAAARACFPGLYLPPVALGPLFAFCLPSFKSALLTFISVLWLWIGAWLPLLCRCACLLVFVHVRFAGLCPLS